MVSGTGKILHTAATDHHDRVLLKIVALTGNVGSHLHTVGESDSGDLSQCRVRLLRGSGLHCGADASLLGSGLVDGLLLERVEAYLQSGCLGLLGGSLASLSNELVKCWYSISPPCQKYSRKNMTMWPKSHTVIVYLPPDGVSTENSGIGLNSGYYSRGKVPRAAKSRPPCREIATIPQLLSR